MKRDCFHSAFLRMTSLLKGSIDSVCPTLLPELSCFLKNGFSFWAFFATAKLIHNCEDHFHFYSFSTVESYIWFISCAHHLTLHITGKNWTWCYIIWLNATKTSQEGVIDPFNNDVTRGKALTSMSFVLNKFSLIANVEPKLTTYWHKMCEQLRNE